MKNFIKEFCNSPKAPAYKIQENKFNQRSVFKITEKKIDKKVNETLKEQELDKVTGGQDDYPCKPKPEDEKPKRNIIRPW